MPQDKSLRQIIKDLINNYGLQDILKEIIEEIKSRHKYNESYLDLLLKDLNTTYQNYLNRYK